jgi:hypothetical protein
MVLAAELSLSSTDSGITSGIPIRQKVFDANTPYWLSATWGQRLPPSNDHVTVMGLGAAY